MKKRKIRSNRGRPARVLDRVEPTPETVAQLTPDPLRVLVDAGHVNTDMERAANEIRSVYLAHIREVMTKLWKPTHLPGGVYEIPDYLAVAHSQRYIPWANEVGPQATNDTLTLVVDRQPVMEWTRVVFALKDYANRLTRG